MKIFLCLGDYVKNYENPRLIRLINIICNTELTFG